MQPSLLCNSLQYLSEFSDRLVNNNGPSVSSPGLVHVCKYPIINDKYSITLKDSRGQPAQNAVYSLQRIKLTAFVHINVSVPDACRVDAPAHTRLIISCLKHGQKATGAALTCGSPAQQQDLQADSCSLQLAIPLQNPRCLGCGFREDDWRLQVAVSCQMNWKETMSSNSCDHRLTLSTVPCAAQGKQSQQPPMSCLVLCGVLQRRASKHDQVCGVSQREPQGLQAFLVWPVRRWQTHMKLQHRRPSRQASQVLQVRTEVLKPLSPSSAGVMPSTKVMSSQVVEYHLDCWQCTSQLRWLIER